MTREAHEEGLALFVSREYRPRFRSSLKDDRLRTKLIGKLPHFKHFDTRYADNVATNWQTSAAVGSELRRRGAAETCYVLSENDDIDGKELRLDNVLGLIVDEGSFQATLVSCLPGQLAYFHGEMPDDRWILDRGQSR